jgi:hypothetical protein
MDSVLRELKNHWGKNLYLWGEYNKQAVKLERNYFVLNLGCHTLKQSFENGIITDGLTQETFKIVGQGGYVQKVWHRRCLETVWYTDN